MLVNRRQMLFTEIYSIPPGSTQVARVQFGGFASSQHTNETSTQMVKQNVTGTPEDTLMPPSGHLPHQRSVVKLESSFQIKNTQYLKYLPSRLMPLKDMLCLSPWPTRCWHPTAFPCFRNTDLVLTCLFSSDKTNGQGLSVSPAVMEAVLMFMSLGMGR
ncbi:uncharacterized protein LOC144307760 isoform X2 [Canis aureus]